MMLAVKFSDMDFVMLGSFPSIHRVFAGGWFNHESVGSFLS